MDTQKQQHPPQLALRFFRWYCRPDRVEELEGDLEEFFHLRLLKGELLWKAKLFFWWNVIRCYRSYAKAKTQKNILMISLFKSYFKLALRHSWKNKWPVSINVVGLGMALSLCVFLYMIYAYNLEFDSFYQNTDNVYRVHAISTDNGQEYRNELTHMAMDQSIRNDISGIQEVSSYFTRTATVKKGIDFFSEYTALVSPEFPQMFEIPLRYGSWEGFGDQPTVYLTKELAKKYFGDEYALGKELTVFFHNDKKLTVTVAGVFEKIPLNTSFDFNLLMGQGNYFRTTGYDMNDWSNKRYMGHYLRVSEANISQVTAGLNKHIELQNKSHETFKFKHFELIPFQDSIHNDELINSKFTNARLRTAVYIIFTILIGMVFLTACFNLANTSMALIARRLKEIGIRKTLGSDNKQILIQFLMEMSIVCALAFIIAMATANTTAQMILGLFSVKFFMQDISLTNIIIFVLVFLTITTLVAGLLPGLYAWKFKPVEIMRKSIKLKGVNWMNKTLVVAQYGFSIAVLVAGITFSQNSNFLNEFSLGYEDDNIIDLRITDENYKVLKQEIEKIPGVTVAGSLNHFGNGGRYSSTVNTKINAEDFTTRYYGVGAEYLELMEVSVISGRNFLKESESEIDNILVSQSFADKYFKDQEVIGANIKINDKSKNIVGVVSDILDNVYTDSQIEPMIVGLVLPEKFRHLVVKTSRTDTENVNEQLKEIWSKQIDRPYTGQLQKDVALGEAGRDTQNLQKIFIAMAILSGFLSIVGIFSLAKLNIAKRIKEITIRKVLGASLKDIVISINKSFLVILGISLVVGTALGYLISDAALGLIYKYYISVSIPGSILTGAGIILLSILMLSGVAIGPANSNPVGGLRED